MSTAGFKTKDGWGEERGNKRRPVNIKSIRQGEKHGGTESAVVKEKVGEGTA